MTETMRNKVIGMFLGIAIGDALGMPLETKTLDEIKALGKVTDYLDPKSHRWFDKFQPGQWTDDTQLSLAITRALIESELFDLVGMIKHQLREMRVSTIGWGKGTKESLERVAKGIPWTKTGSPKSAGNGVAMKVSPIGAYLASRFLYYKNLMGDNEGFKIFWLAFEEENLQETIMLAHVTHKTRVAFASAIAQVNAVFACFIPDDDDFAGYFYRSVIGGSKLGELFFQKSGLVNNSQDSFSGKLEFMAKHELYQREDAAMLAKFCGGANSYAFNSLPFCYAMFLKNPQSVEMLYDAVNAGGDTDTNGSIVGALLGAYNGPSVFPRHLVDGLWRKNEILRIANQFCDKFFPR